MKNGVKLLLKYLITASVAGVCVLLILWLRDFSVAPTLLEKYRILSDAFAVPGVCLIMFSLLIWASSEGAFDFLGYAFNRVGDMMIPGHGAMKKHETYYDYVERKRGKRAKGFWFLFFVGLAFTAVSVVFIILFETL